MPWHCHLSIGGRLSRIESTMKHFSCAGGDRLRTHSHCSLETPRTVMADFFIPSGAGFFTGKNLII